MRSPSASELLNIWERGLYQAPVHRALNLLAAAYPECSLDQLASLSLGQRDGLLLALQASLFGSQITGLATCPHCGDRLELTFAVADLQIGTRSDMPLETAAVGVKAIEAYTVEFRLPNSLDLLAVSNQFNANQPNVDQIRQQLLDRCLSVQQGARSLSVGDLPANVLEAVVAEMEQADPQANVQLALACPACGYEWQTLFDILSFLWSKLHVWARRTLQEVHRLAAAYGWRESEILALSAQRRQLYLEMIGYE
ncbi:MAG: phage baseplate protein [Oscillatoriophycideae cyanobacterium NC_groundwater_1537_Pr4_S-0.65um_50_18]|nr:phage baseplate protein [Oscillatoriophycideae cyanobacterium NC_groundwater_1537_Pr4_S-0.65um_50_18]